MVTYKIGKNSLENLTTAMYDDTKFLYREYIQNAADQIDKAISLGMFEDFHPVIDIKIDVHKRNIIIKDNATGIKLDDVITKLATIADSDKDREKDKGFRGIGRLGGIGYCETLRFITSYQGEPKKTIMSWDAAKCIELIDDRAVRDSAAEILERIITIKTEPCSAEEHFFIVELLNIRKDNTELLDIDEVKAYVASNGPVPFNNKFIYCGKINEFARKTYQPLYEYKVQVNGDDILKEYSTNIYEMVGNQRKKCDDIYDVEFQEFRNKKNELLGWLWFGVSAYEKQIQASVNPMRGLRLRKQNIQIGNSETLERFFKEQRGNGYYIGEVHAVHKDLIPNARRDYFKENVTRNEFEAELKAFFSDKLHNLYYDANKIKNVYKKQNDYIQTRDTYQQKSKEGFVNQKEEKQYVEATETAKINAEKAMRELENLKNRNASNETFQRVFEIITKKHEVKRSLAKDDIPKKSKDEKEEKKNGKTIYVTDNLYHLDNKQRKLVSRIYGVLNDNLPPPIAEEIIKKIQDELNK